MTGTCDDCGTQTAYLIVRVRKGKYVYLCGPCAGYDN